MKKSTIFVLLCAISCTLSSCFTITDFITFNRDGSGSVKTTVDMSNMVQMLGMFLPDSIKKSMQFGDLLQSDMSQFKKINGISHTKISSEKTYSYTISYDFDNVKALNQALSIATDEENGIPIEMANLMKTQYSFKKGKVSRQTSINPNGLSDMEGFNMQESKEMFQFMNSPTYIVSYKLPKSVKKLDLKNEKSTATKNNDTVTIQYNLFDFLETKGEMMNHSIKF